MIICKNVKSEQILVKDDPVKSIKNVCQWRVDKIKELKKKFYKEDVTVVLSRHFAANNYTGICYFIVDNYNDILFCFIYQFYLLIFWYYITTKKNSAFHPYVLIILFTE